MDVPALPHLLSAARAPVKTRREMSDVFCPTYSGVMYSHSLYYAGIGEAVRQTPPGSVISGRRILNVKGIFKHFITLHNLRFSKKTFLSKLYLNHKCMLVPKKCDWCLRYQTHFKVLNGFTSVKKLHVKYLF